MRRSEYSLCEYRQRERREAAVAAAGDGRALVSSRGRSGGPLKRARFPSHIILTPTVAFSLSLLFRGCQGRERSIQRFHLIHHVLSCSPRRLRCARRLLRTRSTQACTAAVSSQAHQRSFKFGEHRG